MLPFKVALGPGGVIVDQIVFAARRAILAGELRPGDPFPSVRTIAADLKVHPNTVMKVTQKLIGEGWLVSKPGVGAFVSERPEVSARDRRQLLEEEAEKIVVEARRVGLQLQDLIDAVSNHWEQMEGGERERR